MPKWSGEELEAAFRHFVEATDRCFVSGDLEDWVNCFTDNVTFRDWGYGFNNGWDMEINGRDAVRTWINGHCGVYPVNHMVAFPIPWYIIDEKKGWVVLEYRNIMADPGDGRDYQEKSYTRLKYAGDRRWRFEEDIYNPLRMRSMLERWHDAKNR